MKDRKCIMLWARRTSGLTLMHCQAMHISSRSRGVKLGGAEVVFGLGLIGFVGLSSCGGLCVVWEFGEADGFYVVRTESEVG